MGNGNGNSRNELDYMLCDTLPDEMVAPYSLVSFYDWLVAPKTREFYKLRKQFFSGKGQEFALQTAASFPHRFQVAKKDGEFRTISCPQPIGSLALSLYIARYQRDLLDLFQRPSFSVRKHCANNKISYVGHQKGGALRYKAQTDSAYMEHSGRFFLLKPAQKLTTLKKTEVWNTIIKKYKDTDCLHVDIQSCFQSIYTHSLGWVIPREGRESKNYSNANDAFYMLDVACRIINGRETNGIAVGPEFSRMAAETLLQEADRDTILRLEKENIKYGVDYSVLRFVDDFYIFSGSSEVEQKVKEEIDASLAQRFLRLNSSKEKRIKVTSFLDRSSHENLIAKLISELSWNMDHADVGTSAEKFRKGTIFCLETVISLIREFADEATGLSSFACRCIFNITVKRRNTLRRLLKLPCASFAWKKDFFALLYKLLEFNPSFYNCQKISLALDAFFYCCPATKQQSTAKAMGCFFKSLFDDLSSDNLYDRFLLLFEAAKVKASISKRALDRISSMVLDKRDPVLLASWLLCLSHGYRSTSTYSKFTRELGSFLQFVCDSFFTGKHKERLFEFQESWTLIIFYKCPLSALAKEVSAIGKLISECASIAFGKRDDYIAHALYRFLLSNQRHYFFEWNFLTYAKQRRWSYLTTKRIEIAGASNYV